MKPLWLTISATKGGGGGGGGHLHWLQNSNRAMKARITTAVLWSMLGFCYIHYQKGLPKIHTTCTMTSRGTRGPARTVTTATIIVLLNCWKLFTTMVSTPSTTPTDSRNVILGCAGLFLVPLINAWLFKVQKVNTFLFQTSCLKMKSTFSGLIRELLLPRSIYSES
jgi:hypothetical protein